MADCVARPLVSRQFCLDQKLPICKDASTGDADPDTATGQEGDVQTKCFRARPPDQCIVDRHMLTLDRTERDSALSYSVVIIFIILTTSLLIWAGIREQFGDRIFQTRLFSSIAVGNRSRKI